MWTFQFHASYFENALEELESENEFIMKKLFSMVFLCLWSLAAPAQEKDVTKFLGIPVDGSKTEMIRKLREKGYRPAALNSEILEGEFNGDNVYIHVVTNNNRVYRLMVADANPIGERDIQIRFNRLCRQFENNPRYTPYKDDQTIPKDEDISYEMHVHKKRYEAIFYQNPELPDSLALRAFLSERYTDEQIEQATDEQKTEIAIESMSYLLDRQSKKSVWFLISERYGKYYICLYYDNKYNEASGEDL